MDNRQKMLSMSVAAFIVGLAFGVLFTFGRPPISQETLGGVINIGRRYFPDGVEIDNTSLVQVGTTLTLTRSSSTPITFGSSTIPGCLEIGDIDAGGVSYCTVLDGTITCSSTEPDSCKP